MSTEMLCFFFGHFYADIDGFPAHILSLTHTLSSLSLPQMLSLAHARPLFLSSRGSISIFLSLSLSSSFSLYLSNALIRYRYLSLLRLWGSLTCSFFLCLDHFYTDTDGFPEHTRSLSLSIALSCACSRSFSLFLSLCGSIYIFPSLSVLSSLSTAPLALDISLFFCVSGFSVGGKLSFPHHFG